MSAKIMGAVWDLDLPANEQIVLLALADHADHAGNNVFPSNGLVAWKCGISSRSVTRIKKQLCDRGILVTVSEEAGRVKEHRINLSAGKLKQPFESEWTKNSEPTPCQSVTPDKSNPLTDGAQPPDKNGNSAANPLTAACHPNRHKEEPSLLEPSLTDGFEIFWKAYPYKVAKGAAVKAWSKIIQKKIPLTVILTAIEQQKDSVLSKTRDGGKFIPFPASWLNAERYLDEVQQPKKAKIENGDTWGNFIPKY